MRALKKYFTVSKEKELIIPNLPFEPGEKIEVVLIAEEENRIKKIQEMKQLFKVTQALPQAQSISEDDIT
ncbi:MAG TPA: hypothetical protein DF383_02045, partial [Deltaproteobacteria bacterium]|nr:hypothetical protein [Deltaproteobacteria bacterium]